MLLNPQLVRHFFVSCDDGVIVSLVVRSVDSHDVKAAYIKASREAASRAFVHRISWMVEVAAVANLEKYKIQ
jgi:hypothetical protein